MPKEIEDLARQMLNNPARVAVTPVASTAERIAQRVVHVSRADKPALLADILRAEPIDRVLVFTRTKHGADKVVRKLNQQGLAAEAIHGNKSQSQRERALGAFRDGRVRTLVATDIAARGIDVEGVSHVVNYDLPNVPESYVHRIGRTARAGAEGVAISFCDGEERAYLRSIEKLIGMTIPASGQAVAETGGHAARPHNGRPHNVRSHNGGPARHGQSRKEGRHNRRPQHAKSGSQGGRKERYNGDIATAGFMQSRP
jgi:ATP-dependent RNA helicase RhlE